MVQGLAFSSSTCFERLAIRPVIRTFGAYHRWTSVAQRSKQWGGWPAGNGRVVVGCLNGSGLVDGQHGKKQLGNGNLSFLNQIYVKPGMTIDVYDLVSLGCFDEIQSKKVAS